MMKMNIVTTIMRVVFGILFLAHGMDKFNTGLGNVAGWFESIHIPGFMAYIVGPVELIGGILLILGLFTRYVSAILFIILLGAVLTTKLSMGLLNGYELDLSFMLIALYLVFAEVTRWSLDHLIFKKAKTN
ncbi:DoxX family protein [Paenibacillus polygoni]|uniref:DoxX family protein n=1 Tax=Paenibacillus polygoni TaxID=3050112 RepID=A0ABY8X1W0_9BACL|nr:DoxX family protein [Paenibacillus polygoni]WIV19144.1 DoxX family protein [Paenibacillus polygoni]